MADRVIGDYTAAITIDGSTNYLLIQPGDASTAYRKINRNVLLGVSGQPADTSTVQAFTNKSLNNTNTVSLLDSLFTLQDNVDSTKQAQFQLSGLTTATTRTYTLPNASSTLVDIVTAQTLANKTLTSPIINGGTYDNGTITVDAIGEHTAANGVTIDGLNIKDGVLNTNNSVVTSNITDGAVTPAKLLAGTGSGWTWASWSPTWTNLTLGNGTLNYARYIQIGKTVHFRLKLTFGNTSAITGSVTFTLPLTANADFTTNDTLSATVQYNDATSTRQSGEVLFNNTTTLVLVANPAAYGVLSSTVPFTWTTNDQIMVSGSYEAA